MKKASQPLVSLDQHIAAQAPAIDTAKPASHTLSANQQAALQAPVVTPKKVIPFRIIEGARPAANLDGRLFAFTQAWMEIAGLQDGKSIPKEDARKVAGDSAISYHTRLGNFETTKDGLTLSVKGRNFFAARIMDKKVDPQKVEAYKAMLIHGKADGNLVKVQSSIVAM